MSGVSKATSCASFAASAGRYAEAVRLRLALGAAAGAGADDHLMAAVAQIARVRAALAAIADDGDRRALRARPASTSWLVKIRSIGRFPFAQKKTPAPVGERGFWFLVLMDCLKL